MTDSTPAPAPSPEPQRALSKTDAFRGVLQKMEGSLASALPSQIDPKKFIGVVMTAVNLNPALLDADRRSMLVACMKAAQDGLLPDGREAAFVLYGKVAQYMPMIGGVLKKLRNSRQLSSISAQVVYAADHFSYELGDEERIVHKPAFGVERGNPTAVYAVAKTKDGAVYREVMSFDEVEKIRNVSRAKNNGPWVQWWGEMAKKTVIRRLCKRLPSSADIEKLWANDNENYDLNQPQQQAPKGPLSRLKASMGIAAEPATAEEIVDVDVELEGTVDAGTSPDAE